MDDNFDNFINGSLKSKTNFSKINNTNTNNSKHKSLIKKVKRLPWNSDVLLDRFTPQLYPIQITHLLNGNSFLRNNTLVFLHDQECKTYLEIMTLKQYAIQLSSSSPQHLLVLITDNNLCVGKFVELISRHTMLRIAGIDFNLIDANFTQLSMKDYCINLKKSAQVLVLSAISMIEWLNNTFIDFNEIMLLIFDNITPSSSYHEVCFNLNSKKK
jgi:hypothetical protein